MKIFLKEYLNILRLEKNLSENTVSSYRNDITCLINFLYSFKIDDPSAVNHKILSDFFVSLQEVGLSRTSAARYYSSIKGFFNYLFSHKYIEANPVEKVPPPKLSKSLPSVLTVAEVDAILSKPVVEEKLGLRDKGCWKYYMPVD